MRHLPLAAFLANLALPFCAAAELAPRFDHQEIDRISIGYGLAIDDVDGDGKPDILLADKTQIVWYANPGKAGEPWKKHIIAEKLTPLDNVCIAARDIDGDGKCEVAVGAMWNPAETNDETKSGSVFYLIRPADPTLKWEPVKLHHEVCTHRMRWVRIGKDGAGKDQYVLVVKPLHGKGNKNGQGAGARVLAYTMPKDPKAPWTTELVNDTVHLSHNFDVVQLPEAPGELLVLGSKEGFTAAVFNKGKWESNPAPFNKLSQGVGEVRFTMFSKKAMIAAVEPMHGDKLVVYVPKGLSDDEVSRVVLDDTLKEGHALAFEDVLGLGRPQIVVGWRTPNTDVKVGVKLFVPNEDATKWDQHLIDDNKMACEDLKVADLDGDGKPEIIAAGRATKNLKIYWNRTEK
jgi:hypothetical protein